MKTEATLLQVLYMMCPRVTALNDAWAHQKKTLQWALEEKFSSSNDNHSWRPREGNGAGESKIEGG